MKGKQLFALSVLALAVNQAVYAEVGMLPEVSVTSSTIDDRFDSKRGESSNINNISGKKVDDRHAKNIVEVLESIPGVTAELQSGDSVKIELRGIEAQRYMGEKPGVAIVIDGVPVNERTGRVNIDLDNIDSIKVIKGGASYLYGEDALSGAVIITTKRGAKMAGVTASTEKGSFNYNKNLAQVGFSRVTGLDIFRPPPLMRMTTTIRVNIPGIIGTANCNIWLMKPAMFLLASKNLYARRIAMAR